jgi:hypothetical protein
MDIKGFERDGESSQFLQARKFTKVSWYRSIQMVVGEVSIHKT